METTQMRKPYTSDVNDAKRENIEEGEAIGEEPIEEWILGEVFKLGT